jgi:hypothetical protein
MLSVVVPSLPTREKVPDGITPNAEFKNLKSKAERPTKKTKLTIASKTRAGNETFQKVLWPFPNTTSPRMPIQGSLTEGEGLSTVDLLVLIN